MKGYKSELKKSAPIVVTPAYLIREFLDLNSWVGVKEDDWQGLVDFVRNFYRTELLRVYSQSFVDILLN